MVRIFICALIVLNQSNAELKVKKVTIKNKKKTYEIDIDSFFYNNEKEAYLSQITGFFKIKSKTINFTSKKAILFILNSDQKIYKSISYDNTFHLNNIKLISKKTQIFIDKNNPYILIDPNYDISFNNCIISSKSSLKANTNQATLFNLNIKFKEYSILSKKGIYNFINNTLKLTNLYCNNNNEEYTADSLEYNKNFLIHNFLYKSKALILKVKNAEGKSISEDISLNNVEITVGSKVLLSNKGVLKNHQATLKEVTILEKNNKIIESDTALIEVQSKKVNLLSLKIKQEEVLIEAESGYIENESLCLVKIKIFKDNNLIMKAESGKINQKKELSAENANIFHKNKTIKAKNVKINENKILEMDNLKVISNNEELLSCSEGYINIKSNELVLSKGSINFNV